MTRFNVGDILEPSNLDDIPENQKSGFYYLVKRATSRGLYDVENIENGEKLYSMAMIFYRKIP